MKPLEKMTKKELIALVKELQAKGEYGAGVIHLYPPCPTCHMQHPQGPGWSCSLTPDGWMTSYDPNLV